MVVLQDDEDFLVEQIIWQGQSAVKKSRKQTTQPERVRRLKNEVHGLKFFSNLVTEHPDIELYVPNLYEHTNTYIVTEYIDAPAVGTNGDSLEKLAKLLARIDRIEPYGEALIEPNFYYKNIRNRFPIWSEQAMASGLLSQVQLNKANQIIDKFEPFLSPRIAHGDLSPTAHALMMPNSKIGLIDYEVFTPEGARYYDVARCYTRLYSETGAANAAKLFLKHFLQYSDSAPRRKEQLLAILVQRVIGMQRDAGVDFTKGRDYRESAQELLNLVLEANLKKMYL